MTSPATSAGFNDGLGRSVRPARAAAAGGRLRRLNDDPTTLGAMPPRKPDLGAALAEHTRALETRIVAERLRAMGAEAAHQALVGVADDRRTRTDRRTPSERGPGWVRVEG
jgi:hypothetical protein